MSRRLLLLLVLLTLLPVTALAAGKPAAPAGAAPVAGTDYVLIEGGQPYAPAAGKIEVAEVFGYVCGACARFEPLFAGWKAKQAPDVKVSLVPAPFGGPWIPYARAYFAGDRLGTTARTHPRVFTALHEAGALPRNPSAEELAAFYAQHGVTAARFVDAYNSDAVTAQLERAQQFIQRSGVESTPTLVINGKYRVLGRSFEDSLRIAEHLIARERRTR